MTLLELESHKAFHVFSVWILKTNFQYTDIEDATNGYLLNRRTEVVMHEVCRDVGSRDHWHPILSIRIGCQWSRLILLWKWMLGNDVKYLSKYLNIYKLLRTCKRWAKTRKFLPSKVCTNKVFIHFVSVEARDSFQIDILYTHYSSYEIPEEGWLTRFLWRHVKDNLVIGYMSYFITFMLIFLEQPSHGYYLIRKNTHSHTNKKRKNSHGNRKIMSLPSLKPWANILTDNSRLAMNC